MLLPASGPQDAFDPRPLFGQVRRSLLGLLHALEPAQWLARTAAAPWLVRDVVGHLVGDDLGRLSRSRDDHSPGHPSEGETLPRFLDRHNAEWVHATQRMSARVLTELLAMTSEQIAAYWNTADLAALGEPVSWAGSVPAPVWLDCARDFTEDWVHQQQIREAVALPSDSDPATVGAVVDTFMHAVPATLHRHAPRDGAGSPATISVRVEDHIGPTVWGWTRIAGEWAPSLPAAQPTATVWCSADTWWRLCVRMLTPEQARARSRVTGDPELGDAVFQVLAIIREP